ncbi:MAG: hypothetical protein ACT4QE_07385 [Anaerolineales bacterium]
MRLRRIDRSHAQLEVTMFRKFIGLMVLALFVLGAVGTALAQVAR